MQCRSDIEAEAGSWRGAGHSGVVLLRAAAAPRRRNEQRSQAAQQVGDDADVDEVRDARKAPQDGRDERLGVARGLEDSEEDGDGMLEGSGSKAPPLDERLGVGRLEPCGRRRGRKGEGGEEQRQVLPRKSAGCCFPPPSSPASTSASSKGSLLPLAPAAFFFFAFFRSCACCSANSRPAPPPARPTSSDPTLMCSRVSKASGRTRRSPPGRSAAAFTAAAMLRTARAVASPPASPLKMAFRAPHADATASASTPVTARATRKPATFA